MRNILLLVSAYIIYRLVRALLRSKIQIRTFHYHNHVPQESKREGEVKITQINPGNKEKKNNNPPATGDYVEYEEVK